MIDPANANDPLHAWDWKSDAQLAALEFDQHPEWDHLDFARNTMVNVLIGCAEVLTVTAEMNRGQRLRVAQYYQYQAARIITDTATDHAASKAFADETGDNGPNGTET